MIMFGWTIFTRCWNRVPGHNIYSESGLLNIALDHMARRWKTKN